MEEGEPEEKGWREKKNRELREYEEDTKKERYVEDERNARIKAWESNDAA